MSINQWVGSGRLGKDPELRQAGDTPVLNLRICANNRRKIKGEWTDVPLWMGVTIFGKRAEALSRILSKGDLLMVSGSLQERTFKTRDGQDRTVVECLADEVDFSTGRNGGGQQPAPASADTPTKDLFGGDDDDDIPF